MKTCPPCRCCRSLCAGVTGPALPFPMQASGVLTALRWGRRTKTLRRGCSQLTRTSPLPQAATDGISLQCGPLTTKSKGCLMLFRLSLYMFRVCLGLEPACSWFVSSGASGVHLTRPWAPASMQPAPGADRAAVLVRGVEIDHLGLHGRGGRRGRGHLGAGVGTSSPVRSVVSTIVKYQ